MSIIYHFEFVLSMIIHVPSKNFAEWACQVQIALRQLVPSWSLPSITKYLSIFKSEWLTKRSYNFLSSHFKSFSNILIWLDPSHMPQKAKVLA
jgi:hypothetical protein